MERGAEDTIASKRSPQTPHPQSPHPQSTPPTQNHRTHPRLNTPHRQQHGKEERRRIFGLPQTPQDAAESVSDSLGPMAKAKVGGGRFGIGFEGVRLLGGLDGVASVRG